jgi:hypothetical protein
MADLMPSTSAQCLHSCATMPPRRLAQGQSCHLEGLPEGGKLLPRGRLASKNQPWAAHSNTKLDYNVTGFGILFHYAKNH